MGSSVQEIPQQVCEEPQRVRSCCLFAYSLRAGARLCRSFDGFDDFPLSRDIQHIERLAFRKYCQYIHPVCIKSSFATNSDSPGPIAPSILMMRIESNVDKKSWERNITWGDLKQKRTNAGTWPGC